MRTFLAGPECDLLTMNLAPLSGILQKAAAFDKSRSYPCGVHRLVLETECGLFILRHEIRAVGLGSKDGWKTCRGENRDEHSEGDVAAKTILSSNSKPRDWKILAQSP